MLQSSTNVILCDTSSSRIKIEILGITVSHVVTIVGTPSYTSGAQLWNGAAATLNKNPTPMINTPNTTEMSFVPAIDTRLQMLSKLVSPVQAQIKLDPNKISADDNAPNRKYFRPADVADSEFRYTAAKIYTAKLCSSIDRYIETRSVLDTKNDAPIVVNKISNGYSAIVGTADCPFT